MNECVEILNRWGESFLAFAWPMLWQSSLLIAVIFAFDLMFARRIRASVRYALWMVVLIKLLLPPALSLPTGASWWLWRPHSVVETPAIKNYTVSFGDSAPETLPPATVPSAESPPKLIGEAWALLVTVAVGVGLLSWLAFRWLSVAAKVHRAANAPAELDGILDEARQMAGRRRPLRLRLIDGRHSPAVYGLFRPVILLPRTLANQLAGRQLRAVLLHEAMHLRRGDIWVNFAQTLLQIAYWWHPLFWVANARIRRVREEAVDDAVMLALRDGADAYAPTMLEVAKFAFRRPLASLGLIGILESRSALRQRVERLVDFQPSRRTGLTILSLCGIFAFSAVALPMGQGPEKTSSTRSSGPETSPSVTTNGLPAIITVTRETTSFGHTNIVFDGRHEALYRKLNQIHFDVFNEDKPLSEVLVDLWQRSGEVAPDEKDLNFLFNPRVGPDWSVPGQKDPNTGLTVKLIPATGPPPADPHGINIKLNLNNVSLRDVLNAICLVSDYAIKYAVEDYGIVFSPKDTNAPQFEMRTFKVSPTFISKLRGSNGPTNEAGHISRMAQSYFSMFGVNLESPETVYYNEGHGVLFVYATPQDLKLIEKEIQILPDPPQIHIKAHFIEVPKKFFSSAAANSLPPGMTNGGILTAGESKKVLQILRSQKGEIELAEPEATTLIGRQAIMRVSAFQPVFTNYSLPTPYLAPHISAFDTGSILDVSPVALSDGYALHLSVAAYQNVCFGYVPIKETPVPAIQVNRASANADIYDGQTVVLFPALEQESVRVVTDDKSQERVTQYIRKARKKQGDKVVVVLATATLIDAAGNRMHSNSDYYDSPYAPNAPGAQLP